MDRGDYSGFGTATDDLDELFDLTGADIARSLYARQKADLALILKRLRVAPWGQPDREAAAALLHRITDTAAYFGDDMLSAVANAATQPIIEANLVADVVSLCESVLPLVEMD